MLANQGGLEPFFDQPLTRPRDRVDTGLQRRRDLAVAPALTTVRGVGFQQDSGLQQLLCWMVSAMDKGGEMLSLLIAQCHYVFLYRDLFPGHQSAPSAATEPSSQTNTAESMTGTTSPTTAILPLEYAALDERCDLHPLTTYGRPASLRSSCPVLHRACALIAPVLLWRLSPASHGSIRCRPSAILRPKYPIQTLPPAAKPKVRKSGRSSIVNSWYSGSVRK